MNMNNLISGSIEAIDQAVELIESLSDEHYRQSLSPLFQSSIGQHIRHTLDLYVAIMRETKDNHYDYDVRRRGATVETDPQAAIDEFAFIKLWLNNLDESCFDQIVTVQTEVGLSEEKQFYGQSSFGRELCFVSSHLIHHMAIMAAIAKSQGLTVDESIGVAPATATYLRAQEEESKCAP